MSQFVDFHVHSNRSCDGDFAPADLIRLAREKGFRAISIADHDSVAAYPEAVEEGGAGCVEVIPSIELTTMFGKREFHLLLPFVDWGSAALASIIESQTRCRKEEAEERIGRLRKIGFSIGWDDVRAKTNGAPPLGVKIAQILLEKPENRKNPALSLFYRPENTPFAPYLFYKDYFTEGKAAYVPKNYVALDEVLALAPETGGVPVLSHPGAYFQQTTEEDARTLKDQGLQGLEVYTSYHKASQVKEYESMAEELDLVPTAGSDFHGRIKPHVVFGDLREGRYWMVEKLRARKEGAA